MYSLNSRITLRDPKQNQGSGCPPNAFGALSSGRSAAMRCSVGFTVDVF